MEKTNNHPSQLLNENNPIIKLSVTNRYYRTKPQSEDIKRMKFSRQFLSIQEFCQRISQGYCFCHWFNASESFGVSKKIMANFNCANVVFIDIDKASVQMCDYVESLNIKPTIYYTTPSNSPGENKNCFRLCYVFEDDILSPDLYQSLSLSISQALKTDVPAVKLDATANNCAQYMNGNGSGRCIVKSTDNIYRISQFDLQAIPDTIKPRNIKPTDSKSIDYTSLITDKDFMMDFSEMRREELFAKYESKYPFFDKGETEKQEGYYYFPEDYTEIKRKVRLETFDLDEKLKCFSQQRMIKDGEGRRNKLYTGCLIRRQINPNVSFEHLLMNLIVETLYYFDNSKEDLTNEVLMRIAYNALMLPLEDIHIEKYRPQEFCVDREYCELNGISVRTQCNRVRTLLTDKKIAKFYDPTKSTRKNHAFLREMGVDVQLARVKQYARKQH